MNPAIETATKGLTPAQLDAFFAFFVGYTEKHIPQNIIERAAQHARAHALETEKASV